MARKPRDYAAEYERRQLLGRRRGFSTQRMRGHGTPKSISGISEYEAYSQRQRAKGELTPRERGFISRQEQRSRNYDFDELRSLFLSLEPRQRERIMDRQLLLQRRFGKGAKRRRRNIQERLAEVGVYPEDDIFNVEPALFYYHTI